MDSKTLSTGSLIDLRPERSFIECHVLNSTNIPLAELSHRIHELPPNSQSLNLLGYQEDLSDATYILASKGYRVDVTQATTDGELLAKKDGCYLVTGNASKRLWKPASVVKDFVEHYADLCDKKIGLDVACGSGRDSVYLANKGWSMTSVDHSSSALERLRLLAKTNQQSIDDRQLCLEQGIQCLSSIKACYSAIVVVRYLHRPLFEPLKSLIAPKGFIIYQTFLRGSEQFGSPKNPRYLLKQGELAQRFCDFKIHKDHVEYLADGRPTNCFIAQKN